MGNLKLGDWVEEVPVPPVGAIGTADILGSLYPTIIGPEASAEWTTWNLSWAGAGVDYNNDVANRPLFGRLYTHAQMLAIDEELPSGWRVPRLSDWDALVSASGGFSTAGGPLKSAGTMYWNTPNTGALDTFGIDVRGAGYYKSDDGFPWYQLRETGAYWIGGSVISTNPTDKSQVYFRYNTAAVEFYNIDQNTRHFSIRLVRDVAPIIKSGTHDLLVLPSGLAQTTDSLAQRIDIRLRTFLGEHWLNPELGIPWFRDFLTKAPDLAVCRQVLWDTILGVRGVRTINGLDLAINKATRVLTVTFAVNGIDSFTSTITV